KEGLSRFALHQARQLADIAAGMAHEEAPRRPDRIDHADPDIAQQAQGRNVVGEEPVQPVHGERHDERIKASPALIPLQRREAADIKSEPCGIEDNLAQRRRILEPEIETLARKGMDAMRGVAGERETRLHETAREMEFEWIGPA